MTEPLTSGVMPPTLPAMGRAALASEASIPVLDDLRRYDLELERVRLMMLRTLGSEPAAAELALVEAALGRAQPGRIEQIARRLGLSAEVVRFVWTAVACGFDPSCAPHAEALGGVESRGGASLLLHMRARALDPEAARRLARELTGDHPLTRTSLLIGAAGPGAGVRVWRVPERFAAFLAGSDAVDPILAPLGGLLASPAGFVLGAEQREVADLVGRNVASGSSAILLEGSAGVGRRTICALAAAEAGRPLVHVDASRRRPRTSRRCSVR
jgi:hypothetical protein